MGEAVGDPERTRVDGVQCSVRGVCQTVRSIVPAAVAGLALAAGLAVNEHLRTGAMLFPSGVRRWAVAFAFASAAAAGTGRLLLKSARRESCGRSLAVMPPAVLLASCAAFLFSGAMFHPWSYFIGWMPHLGRGPANLWAGLPRWIVLTAVLTPFLAARRKGLWKALFGLLVAAQIASFAVLLWTTGGTALYRDDHPSFMFRLWELSRTFPQFVNYNPWWNGGAVNAYCLSSGTGALGFPLFPLWRLSAIHEVYTAGVGVMYILVMPLLAAASLRIMGARRSAAACAGLLALGVSRHFFLWLLHYGTVCAPLAAFFVLPVAACLYRVLCLDRREAWLGVCLALSVVMLLQWPPGALMMAPVAVSFLCAWRRWSWHKIRFVLICAAAVGLLCFRQFAVILFKAGTVVSHVMGSAPEDGAGSLADAAGKGLHYLAAHLQEGHPVLLFLGLAGLFALRARGVRRWFGPALLCFALVTGWGPQVKPHLELGRMAIPMMFLAVGPAAVACSRLLAAADWRLAPARAALIALLGMGAWNVAELYGNRGSAPYTVLPQTIVDFAERLRNEVPEGGRVMFAGPTVHYFGRGHVAYLPVLTGREMMAVDYYHFPTTYVRYEYPPDGFNETPGRVLDFVRLYNVTHVVSYHDRWKSFFRELSAECEELEGCEGIRAAVFRMRRRPTLFLKGDGRVTAHFSRLDVRVGDPDREAVLAYNWVPGLSAPAPVEIFAYDAGQGVQLIGIRPNGLARFRIRYRSFF